MTRCYIFAKKCNRYILFNRFSANIYCGIDNVSYVIIETFVYLFMFFTNMNVQLNIKSKDVLSCKDSKSKHVILNKKTKKNFIYRQI